MSLRLSLASIRAYDALRTRPGAAPRRSGARDAQVLGAVERRIREMIGDGRVGMQDGFGNQPYVFWSEIEARVAEGAFDDLLPSL
ncbi:MAG: hypothetical protein ACKO5K_00465 [Armatimonadota bacterium]